MRACFLLGSLLLFACTTTTTSSSSPSPSSSTNPTSSTLDANACQSRCVAKAESCGGVPESSENPGGTEGYCQDVCSSGLTDAQMTCLEGKSCSALLSGSLASLCPASSSTSSSSSGGSSSGSTSTSAKSVGDACTCSKYGTEPNVYKTCTGNTSACFDLDLACLAEASTGKGECVVTCSASDVGSKCPSGGTCRKSTKKAIDGEYWTICE